MIGQKDTSFSFPLGRTTTLGSCSEMRFVARKWGSGEAAKTDAGWTTHRWLTDSRPSVCWWWCLGSLSCKHCPTLERTVLNHVWTAVFLKRSEADQYLKICPLCLLCWVEKAQMLHMAQLLKWLKKASFFLMRECLSLRALMRPVNHIKRKDVLHHSKNENGKVLANCYLATKLFGTKKPVNWTFAWKVNFLPVSLQLVQTHKWRLKKQRLADRCDGCLRKSQNRLWMWILDVLSWLPITCSKRFSGCLLIFLIHVFDLQQDITRRNTIWGRICGTLIKKNTVRCGLQGSVRKGAFTFAPCKSWWCLPCPDMFRRFGFPWMIEVKFVLCRLYWRRIYLSLGLALTALCLFMLTMRKPTLVPPLKGHIDLIVLKHLKPQNVHVTFGFDFRSWKNWTCKTPLTEQWGPCKLFLEESLCWIRVAALSHGRQHAIQVAVGQKRYPKNLIGKRKNWQNLWPLRLSFFDPKPCVMFLYFRFPSSGRVDAVNVKALEKHLHGIPEATQPSCNSRKILRKTCNARLARFRGIDLPSYSPLVLRKLDRSALASRCSKGVIKIY